MNEQQLHDAIREMLVGFDSDVTLGARPPSIRLARLKELEDGRVCWRVDITMVVNCPAPEEQTA
jgi:hypothetical protein